MAAPDHFRERNAEPPMYRAGIFGRQNRFLAAKGGESRNSTQHERLS